MFNVGSSERKEDVSRVLNGGTVYPTNRCFINYENRLPQGSRKKKAEADYYCIRTCMLAVARELIAFSTVGAYQTDDKVRESHTMRAPRADFSAQV